MAAAFKSVEYMVPIVVSKKSVPFSTSAGIIWNNLGEPVLEAFQVQKKKRKAW